MRNISQNSINIILFKNYGEEMKKQKISKKLGLKKETIANLDKNQLSNIKGGAGPICSIRTQLWSCDNPRP